MEHVSPLVEGNAVFLVTPFEVVSKGAFPYFRLYSYEVEQELVHRVVFVLLNCFLKLGDYSVPVHDQQVDLLVSGVSLVFESLSYVVNVLVEGPALLDQVVYHFLFEEELLHDQQNIILSVNFMHDGSSN